ncbi:MAG: hypothetical protein M1825_003146 [Sarcosagium campestre]|nr:MAG: hypothetical protein M1825_003146 [Sarcosagium campestre]
MTSQLSYPIATNPGTQIFRDVAPLRTWRRDLLLSGRTLGLVPTMGALHAGHLSLIRQAAHENTDVMVSIYVNPTQFGENEDLDSYPRTWDADIAALAALDSELASTPTSTSTNTSDQSVSKDGRITAIFAPTTKTMYPTLPPTSALDGPGSFVTITPLSQRLEGASRPVFFRGVSTVCMKLFNIATPERAYFGQKDIQQTVVVRRMVRDFHVPNEVRVVPTQRDSADGLALSSRNVYLGQRRRHVATILYEALTLGEEMYVLKGKRSRAFIWGVVVDRIAAVQSAQERITVPSERARLVLDYVSLADPDTLDELDDEVDPARGAVLSVAVVMQPLEDPQPDEDCGVGGGKVPVRLIDNIILPPRP